MRPNRSRSRSPGPAGSASHVLRGSALLLAIALAPSLAFAQTADAYPAKPVRLIVPYAPGGPSDIVGRLVAAKLGEAWSQQVLVENRPGANANLGAEAAARAPADGYTLLLGTGSTHGINSALYPKLPFDPVRDFAPIVKLTDSTLYVAVPATLPVKSVRELVDYARAHPGKLNYGSVGAGSAHHLAGEMLKLKSGIQMTHVPYKGSAPARTALLQGEVQVLFDSGILPFARQGKATVLAVTSERRWAASPEIPTMIEQGFADFVVGGWFALFAPAGTPAAIVRRVNADTNKVLALPDVRERLAAQGTQVEGGTPEALAALVAAELKRWPPVVQASGARLE